MDWIPDAWPPAEPDGPVVPVFPLGDVWLFPRVLLPLHVFEPRYRQMIEDSLDGPGRLVIATVVDGHDGEMAGSPPVYPVAGLGEIYRHEKLDDGRFRILVAGLCRVRMNETESDRPYRQARVERVLETEPPAEERETLRLELKQAVLAAGASTDDDEVLERLPVGSLADLLTVQLDSERPVKQEIFETFDEGERAQRVLREFETMRRRRDDLD